MSWIDAVLEREWKVLEMRREEMHNGLRDLVHGHQCLVTTFSEGVGDGRRGLSCFVLFCLVVWLGEKRRVGDGWTLLCCIKG